MTQEHPAIVASRRWVDTCLWASGYDLATRKGFLGKYMEMLNRAGNGGYPVGLIGLAKANPGHDVAKLEYGK